MSSNDAVLPLSKPAVMANHPPPLTVYTPAYNREKYLSETIDCILQQDFGDFEYAIYDDGSTDGTAEVIRDYAARDKRIRPVFTKENQGVIYQANLAISQTHSPLLARIDSDDYSPPYRLGMQVDYLNRNYETVGVSGKCLSFSGSLDDKLKNSYLVPRTTEARDARLYYKFQPNCYSVSLCQGASMIRTDALRMAGGYLSRFPCSEESFLFRMLSLYGDVVNLSEVMLLIRTHDEQMTSQKNLVNRYQQSITHACTLECFSQILQGKPDPLHGRIEPVTIDTLQQIGHSSQDKKIVVSEYFTHVLCIDPEHKDLDTLCTQVSHQMLWFRVRPQLLPIIRLYLRKIVSAKLSIANRLKCLSVLIFDIPIAIGVVVTSKIATKLKINITTNSLFISGHMPLQEYAKKDQIHIRTDLREEYARIRDKK